ncbi:MAG TPA: YbaK/EbsC family protein, partial [Anaerolineales bacterium]|nr:YbaK/EbsC family protein [Anaerolineales bacterium]
LVCSNCGYADAQRTARSKKPSPDAEPPLPVERVATPDCHTIESLATFLGISQARTAKALLYVRAGADDLVFVLVRGDMQASETKLRSISGALRAATPSQILAAGAVPGYASPIGLSGVEIIVDDLIPGSPNLVAGANEDGFHLRNTNYGRDYAATRIADITLAQPGDACAQCGEPLHAANGYVVSDTGGFKPLAAVLSLAEKCRDERGLVIPFGMGAFDVHLLHLPSRTGLTAPLAEELYALLERASIPVLYDDRDERAGVKFNDADLIGCPVRITVGEKHANDRMVELKARSQSEIDLTPMGDVVDRVHSLANMNPIA